MLVYQRVCIPVLLSWACDDWVTLKAPWLRHGHGPKGLCYSSTGWKKARGLAAASRSLALTDSALLRACECCDVTSPSFCFSLSFDRSVIDSDNVHVLSFYAFFQNFPILSTFPLSDWGFQDVAYPARLGIRQRHKQLVLPEKSNRTIWVWINTY